MYVSTRGMFCRKCYVEVTECIRNNFYCFSFFNRPLQSTYSVKEQREFYIASLNLHLRPNGKYYTFSK